MWTAGAVVAVDFAGLIVPLVFRSSGTRAVCGICPGMMGEHVSSHKSRKKDKVRWY